jgi:hypothetical protein
MLEHLEWKSLEQRRKDARLTMMYKITNEKVTIPKVKASTDGAVTTPGGRAFQSLIVRG